MTDPADVVSAFLHVAQNTDPFESSYTGDGADFYTSVQFKRGYPLGETYTPTVALELSGGNSQRVGLGTVRQYRFPSIIVHVLTEGELESQRVIEHLRNAWQADFDVDTGVGSGAVGDGYLRITAEVGDIKFTESRKVPWDEAGRINRRTFEIIPSFADIT